MGQVGEDGEIRNPVWDMSSLKCVSDKESLSILDWNLAERPELELQIWEISPHR